MSLPRSTNGYTHLIGSVLINKTTGIEYSIQKMEEDRDQVYNMTYGHYGKAYRVYLTIVANPELETRTGFGSFSGETTEEFQRMKVPGRGSTEAKDADCDDLIQSFHFRDFEEVVKQYGELYIKPKATLTVRPPQVFIKQKWSKIHPEV
jgi:hypothetical protein